jgi:hypothetical protein
MVQSAWANQRIHFAFVEAIDKRLDHDSHVIELSFLEEGNPACPVVREGSNYLIFAWRIHTEDVAFNRIQHGNLVVAFIFMKLVFHQLAGPSWYWNHGKSLPEQHVFPHDSDEAAGQRTAAVRKRHQADRRQHDPSSYLSAKRLQ